jgi:uracil-DNA glycosylase
MHASQRRMSSFLKLTDQIFACRRCDEDWGFSSPSPEAGYFKFPPVIGKTENAQLLFVGINPRISDSNRWLHKHLMKNKASFLGFSANRVHDKPYIASVGQESHYRLHVEFINKAFGRNCPFEQVAAVTEILLCATSNSRNLPYPESPCADLYFGEVIRLTKPRVIVAVGARVVNYFKTRQHGYWAGSQLFLKFIDRDVPVATIPHPGDPNLSESQKIEQVFSVAAETRALLQISSPRI